MWVFILEMILFVITMVGFGFVCSYIMQSGAKPSNRHSKLFYAHITEISPSAKDVFECLERNDIDIQYLKH